MNPAAFINRLRALRRSHAGRINGRTDGVNLTPSELVKRWDGAYSAGSLANWRAATDGHTRGPRFIKVAGRVLYPLASVEAFEALQLILSNPGERQC